MALFKITLSAASFLLIFLWKTGFCQVFPDHFVDSTLRSGINSIITQDYNKAERLFTRLDIDYPQIPLGKIYLAAVQIARSYDYGVEYNSSYIDSLLNSAKEQSNTLLNKDENDIWYKYFLSLSEGYLAYFNALDENWLKSVPEGLNALDDFEYIIKQDKNFYEAFIAIGTFKYWKSRKTEFFGWLPGYSDEKQEGINFLYKAKKYSTYNKYLAINSLIWINIDQGKSGEAVKLAQAALKEYPGSRFFLWGLARAYEDINPENAISVYYEILNSLPFISNHYNEIIIKHLIAQEYKKIGNNQTALKLCDEILSIQFSNESDYSRLKDRLTRIKELKKELSP